VGGTEISKVPQLPQLRWWRIIAVFLVVRFFRMFLVSSPFSPLLAVSRKIIMVAGISLELKAWFAGCAGTSHILEKRSKRYLAGLVAARSKRQLFNFQAYLGGCVEDLGE
jgi:hypothetical protein